MKENKDIALICFLVGIAIVFDYCKRFKPKGSNLREKRLLYFK